MSYTAEYLIDDQRDFQVWCRFDYDVEPASGDGWNEPREEAHVYVVNGSASVYIVRIKTKSEFRNGTYVRLGEKREITDRGAAPEWVYDILRNDEDFLSDLGASDGYGPDPDAARDARIDLELSER